jgi:hypothetical protein
MYGGVNAQRILRVVKTGERLHPTLRKREGWNT